MPDHLLSYDHRPGHPERASAFARPKDMDFNCTDQSLLRAVQAYLTGTDDVLVARYLGINHTTLKDYTGRPGWRFIEDCVREDVRRVALSNLTRLTHRCFTLIDERLDKGDPIYGQDGEVIGYRAIRAKDLSTMVQQFLHQSLEIEERTTRKKENESMELRELAKSLRNFAMEKHLRREEKEVIEVPASAP